MIAKINWKPTHSDLKKFGLAIIIGFALIGSLIGWKHSWATAYWMWGVSAGIGILAIFLPPLSKPFYFVWMAIAFIMGTVVSTVVLILIFYLVLTPMGLLLRIIGRDALRLKKSSFEGDTYWQAHPENFEKKYYTRLF